MTLVLPTWPVSREDGGIIARFIHLPEETLVYWMNRATKSPFSVLFQGCWPRSYLEAHPEIPRPLPSCLKPVRRLGVPFPAIFKNRFRFERFGLQMLIPPGVRILRIFFPNLKLLAAIAGPSMQETNVWSYRNNAAEIRLLVQQFLLRTQNTWKVMTLESLTLNGSSFWYSL
jgi:hypothetical protein